MIAFWGRCKIHALSVGGHCGNIGPQNSGGDKEGGTEDDHGGGEPSMVAAKLAANFRIPWLGKAIVEFAERCADQNEQDHSVFAAEFEQDGHEAVELSRKTGDDPRGVW